MSWKISHSSYGTAPVVSGNLSIRFQYSIGDWLDVSLRGMQYSRREAKKFSCGSVFRLFASHPTVSTPANRTDCHLHGIVILSCCRLLRFSNGSIYLGSSDVIVPLAHAAALPCQPCLSLLHYNRCSPTVLWVAAATHAAGRAHRRSAEGPARPPARAPGPGALALAAGRDQCRGEDAVYLNARNDRCGRYGITFRDARTDSLAPVTVCLSV